MHRVSGFVVAGFYAPASAPLLGAAGHEAPANIAAVLPLVRVEAAADLRDLLTSARGAPPLLCALAASTIWGIGRFGGWEDAPATPVGSGVRAQIKELQEMKLSAADLRMLMDSLSTADPCVREVSVRLVGRNGGDVVVDGLTQRLVSPTPQLREA